MARLIKPILGDATSTAPAGRTLVTPTDTTAVEPPKPSLFNRLKDFGREAIDATHAPEALITGASAIEAGAHAVKAGLMDPVGVFKSEVLGKDLTGPAAGEFAKANDILTKKYKTLAGETTPISIEQPGRVFAAGAGIASTIAGGGEAKAATSLVGATVKTGLVDTAKTLVKDVAEEGAVTTAKKIFTRKVAGQVLADFTLGGVSMGASESQREGATPQSIAQQTLIGGATSVVLPRVLGAATSGAMSLFGRLGEKVSQTLESSATKLEGIAAPTAITKGSRFYEAVDKPVATLPQKVAGVAATTLRGIQAVPSHLATALDRYAPIGRLTAKAESAGIAVPDLQDMAQATGYRAAGKAENRLDDYLALRASHGADWNNVKEMSHYLDDLDRLHNGNAIAGGRNVESVTTDLQKLETSIGPEAFARAKEGQKQLQVFLNQELESARASGRLSQEGYDTIKAAHPNYIPHDVLDFQDAVQSGTGKSLSVAKNGIEKAVGSTREIGDIDEAIVGRLSRNSLLNEKNLTTAAVIQAGNDIGQKAGFVPLRTEANVTARAAHYKELQDIRAQLQQAADSTSLATAGGRQASKEVVRLQKLLDEHEASFFSNLGALHGQGDESAKLYERAVQDKLAREASSTAFTDTEKELGYQRFKKDAARRPWMLGTDDAGLKAKMPKENIDDKYFAAGSQGQTNNEILQEFKDRLAQEKTPLKKGFIKTYEAQGKKVATSESQMVGTASDVSLAKNTKEDFNTWLAHIKDRISGIKDTRSGIFADLQKLKDVETKAVDFKKAGFELVHYFKNGVREDYLVPKDIGYALKNLDPNQSSVAMNWLNNTTFGKIITAPSSALRKLVTSLNPVFSIFRNPGRDIQTALITSDVAAQDFAHGLAAAIRGPKGADEFYRLARSSGALQGSIYQEEKNAADILTKKLEPKSFFGTIVRPDKIIEEAGQKMEEMTRLSVFKSALRAGKTNQEAAKLARDATVDFGKSGNVLQLINKFVPFLNARVQGASNLIKAIGKNPTQVYRKLMWSAAVPSAMLTSMNSRYESYQTISDNEKRKYWIIMVGESNGKDYDNRPIKIPNYIKIPKGEAQQVVSNVVERMLTIGKQKYPDSTAAFGMKLLGDFSPVTESSIWPAGVSQYKDVSTNLNAFTGKKIVTDYVENKQTEKIPGKKTKMVQASTLEPRFQYNESNTSEMAKVLGQALNWSPAKIDYVIKTGVLGDIVRGVDTVTQGFKPGTSMFQRLQQLPVVGGTVGTQFNGEAEQKKNAELQKSIDLTTQQIEKPAPPPIKSGKGRTIVKIAAHAR